ncbi:MAG: hypothetical protein AAF484_02055 [Pseudomonadota bacterium]
MRLGAPRLAICIAVMALICAGAALANPTASRFSDARFETGGLVVMQPGGGAAAEDKIVLLWVYQSKLGLYLNRRGPSAAETAEMRRLCREMHTVAQKELGRGVDGYGIEFADGAGDTSKLPVSRRVVFFFWDGGACARAPSRGSIS